MDAKLRDEIDTIVRDRILAYHHGLITKGQIEDVAVDIWTQLPTLAPGTGPPTNRPASDCSQSGHTPQDDRQGDPPPQPADPVQPSLCEGEHA